MFLKQVEEKLNNVAVPIPSPLGLSSDSFPISSVRFLPIGKLETDGIEMLCPGMLDDGPQTFFMQGAKFVQE